MVDSYPKVPKIVNKRQKTGGGSRLGRPNRSTQAAREAIALFVDDNADRLQEWLDAIAEGITQEDEDGNKTVLVPPNPTKAFELFQSVIEYHVPKLARTELTGADGGPIIIQSTPTDEAL